MRGRGAGRIPAVKPGIIYWLEKLTAAGIDATADTREAARIPMD
jgi:hypothetical protein